jgi:hypothetical protein
VLHSFVLPSNLALMFLFRPTFTSPQRHSLRRGCRKRSSRSAKQPTHLKPRTFPQHPRTAKSVHTRRDGWSLRPQASPWRTNFVCAVSLRDPLGMSLFRFVVVNHRSSWLTDIWACLNNIASCRKFPKSLMQLNAHSRCHFCSRGSYIYGSGSKRL